MNSSDGRCLGELGLRTHAVLEPASGRSVSSVSSSLQSKGDRAVGMLSDLVGRLGARAIHGLAEADEMVASLATRSRRSAGSPRRSPAPPAALARRRRAARHTARGQRAASARAARRAAEVASERQSPPVRSPSLALAPSLGRRRVPPAGSGQGLDGQLVAAPSAGSSSNSVPVSLHASDHATTITHDHDADATITATGTARTTGNFFIGFSARTARARQLIVKRNKGRAHRARLGVWIVPP